MALNWSAVIVPAFLFFTWIEYVVARKKKQAVFSFENSITNISIGIAERLMGIFVSIAFLDVFTYIHDHYKMFDLGSNAATWTILLLGTDLVWYWYHRFGHEINILWAAHIVHHQSEDFNYTVSARITLFQAVIRNLFWCVLPLIGFPPLMITTILVIHGTYSFFTHTQVVNRLGWLEKILVTPSHHRVHHASNEQYINKNYGDLFIFWDKIFGTFAEEKDKPVYGLTHPLKSYSFLWQHFHYYAELFAAARLKRTFKEKIKVFIDPPETLHQHIRPKLEEIFLSGSRKERVTGFNPYLVWQIALSLVILFVITLFSKEISSLTFWSASALLMITLINCGAILEQRRYVYYLEYIRLMIVVVWMSIELNNLDLLAAASVFVIISLSSQTVKQWYFRLVYRRAEK